MKENNSAVMTQSLMNERNGNPASYIALFCILCILLVLSVAFLPTSAEIEIYDSTLRLHVLANSDSDDDQALKLAVRDAVVAYLAEFAQDGASSTDIDIADALAFAADNLGQIKAIAEYIIAAIGYDYPVEVLLTREYYPTREYDDLKLPAGTYNSLQVKIGAAEGRNWWCVLYPPICLSPATAVQTLGNSNMTDDQIKIVTESEKNARYKVKFKFLEVFGR